MKNYDLTTQNIYILSNLWQKEHTDTIPQGKLFIVIKSDNSFGKGKLKLQYRNWHFSTS